MLKWKLSQSNGKNENGFTLLEVLLTLSILSLTVFLFSLSVTQIRTTRDNIKDDRQIEWHLFLNQLEEDLKDSEFDRANSMQLIVQKPNKDTQRLETVTYDRRPRLIRRQVRDGYEPVLTEVTESRFEAIGEQVKISVTFENGESYQAYVGINKVSE